MSHQFVRILCFGLVLFSLVIAAPPGPVPATAASQPPPGMIWEEGVLVRADEQREASAPAARAAVAGITYRTFSGTSFQPTTSSLTYAPLGGAIYATAVPPGGFSFSLDFELPSGTTIVEVAFFVVDNAAETIVLGLRSYVPETDSYTILESGASVGASAALQTIVLTVDPPVVVDNATTAYRLRVAPGVATSSHLLRGARIGYVVSATYLTTITK